MTGRRLPVLAAFVVGAVATAIALQFWPSLRKHMTKPGATAAVVRVMPAIGNMDKSVFLIGGWDGHGFHRDVHKLEGNAWKRIQAQAPWQPRTYHSSITFAGKMWIFGGFTTANPPSNVILITNEAQLVSQ